MSSAPIPVVEAKPRIALAAGLEVFTSPFGPNTSTPHERFDSTAWLKLSLMRARCCSAFDCTCNSCFCCFSCWITVLYKCSGRVSSDGVGFAEKSRSSVMLFFSMRMKSNPIRNASVEQNSTTPARRTTGFDRILTTALHTSAGTGCRRRMRSAPCFPETPQTASDNCDTQPAPTATRAAGPPARWPVAS